MFGRKKRTQEQQYEYYAAFGEDEKEGTIWCHLHYTETGLRDEAFAEISKAVLDALEKRMEGKSRLIYFEDSIHGCLEISAEKAGFDFFAFCRILSEVCTEHERKLSFVYNAPPKEKAP